MKRFWNGIRNFFLPPADAKTFLRILPLITVAFIIIVVFVLATVTWEETNQTSFCGLTCHTMPPEYVTHQDSPHTNVFCEDCHMGRDRLSVLIGRKIRYSWQTGSAMVLNTYEYPIRAKNMAPARDACENCHKPEKFSTDKLVEINHYAQDEANTSTTTFLVVKTGGGTKREGLGFGIHWHIENPVYFYANDKAQQEIPYVVVENDDGTQTEYIDVESGFDPSTVNKNDLVEMDCITCHNRTAHMVDSPQQSMDNLISRGLISVDIPNIMQKGVEVLSASYTSDDEAMTAIDGLGSYYQASQADFYSANKDTIDAAVAAIKDVYSRTNFIDQKVNWETHPNNLAHLDSPGCFRCHDGKHLNQADEAVRLECNLCHSIPVVSSPTQFTTNLELSKGFEPDSHKNASWINLHRTVFDTTCAGCHTVEDAGGTSDTSFCSNSACHGANWQFAGFDAPMLREIMAEQAKQLNGGSESSESTPESNETVAEDDETDTEGSETAPAGGESAPAVEGPATYATLQPVFENQCGACHGEAAMGGLNLTTYATLMAGGEKGAIVNPGEPEGSVLVQIQSGEHFGQLTSEELDLVKQWITDGAPE